eukprot:CAMPEP_0197301974 /NCGR_PEP_ID=MMETSP0890-20130614/50756_1 /TAXON_ID=44058 ORGANISM="Aureoumbra lagunensis, Strain CCMP1510" /NCGR_SAMPLE_ID=MMETSP0890 /ASSEMBLY_ACC=CAM_ASM_000533 /LENGTH=39 /DNA_ID= /DNA_START= /DNA_END= /DNA_ORIENTATION=
MKSLASPKVGAVDTAEGGGALGLGGNGGDRVLHRQRGWR